MTPYERLLAVRTHTGLTWAALSRKMGLKSSQGFTDIRNGRHGISKDMATRMVAAVPGLSLQWLISEVGEMFESSSQPGIPFYRITGAPLPDESDRHMTVGELFDGADLVVENYTEATEAYPTGAILPCKRIENLSSVVYGNDYLITTADFCLIKRVQSANTPGAFRLYSTNQAVYPDGRMVFEPFDVELANINNVYTIMGVITLGSPKIK